MKPITDTEATCREEGWVPATELTLPTPQLLALRTLEPDAAERFEFDLHHVSLYFNHERQEFANADSWGGLAEGMGLAVFGGEMRIPDYLSADGKRAARVARNAIAPFDPELPGKRDAHYSIFRGRVALDPDCAAGSVLVVCHVTHTGLRTFYEVSRQALDAMRAALSANGFLVTTDGQYTTIVHANTTASY